ncbi:MAG: hypothetical protein EXR66_08965 [Dehalococcoidia bacterium]|nr:hypothetical protein [Dehalococcoidia bacterium]
MEIARPPADVFAYGTNPRNIPKWRPIALEVLNVVEPIGVGSTFDLVENMMGRRQFGQRVLEHVPDQLHVIETTSGPVRPIQHHSFGAPAFGGTRYTARLEVYTQVPMRLFEPPLRGRVRKSMAKYGLNLKRVLEAS